MSRPAKDPSEKKQKIMLRLDPEIITHFKATGPGWHTRINNVLLEHTRKGK